MSRGPVDPYELVEGEPDDPDPEPSPSPPRPEPIPSAPRRDRPASAIVPWSRGAEWGPDLLRLALVVLAWGVGVWSLSGVIPFGATFLLILIGLAVAALLCYPMVITLEVPARVAPEQAPRDYFEALSHGRPHFRRMWLLLSEAGRDTPAYHDFAQFRHYWERQLDGLAEKPRRPWWNRVSFEVVDYKGPKAQGLTDLRASFRVIARRDGRELASHVVKCELERGPDHLWYLGDGRWNTTG